MEIECTVITTVDKRELVLVGNGDLDGRLCVALVDLAAFDVAMRALVCREPAPGPPEILWLERRGENLLPLDAAAQRRLSEQMAGGMLGWATL